MSGFRGAGFWWGSALPMTHMLRGTQQHFNRTSAIRASDKSATSMLEIADSRTSTKLWLPTGESRKDVAKSGRCSSILNQCTDGRDTFTGDFLRRPRPQGRIRRFVIDIPLVAFFHQQLQDFPPAHDTFAGRQAV